MELMPRERYCRAGGLEPIDKARVDDAGSAIDGIQRGLHGIDAGTGEDAEAAFASLERDFGIVEPGSASDDIDRQSQELADRTD